MTLSELEGILAGHTDILILTHNNPDPDAIAAGYGLQYLFSQQFGKEGTLAYAGVLGRAENQAMVSLLGIPIVPIHEVDAGEHELYVLVDTQTDAGNHSLPRLSRPTIVIDHHLSPPGQADLPNVFHDVRVDYGATSTIVAEYLFASGLSLPKNVATALYYGIRADTLELGREAGPPDEQAYVKLFPLIDKRVISRIHYPDLPPKIFLLFMRAIESAEIYGYFLFTYLGKLERPDILAQMSDILVRLQGIQWVVSCGVYDGSLFFSVRSDLLDTEAGSLVREIVGDRGSAGGHRTMAGGTIGLGKAESENPEAMVSWIRGRFLKKLDLEAARQTTIQMRAEENDGHQPASEEKAR
jgi:nanoRNase/pAp phosphatase (c-di-AMP/oligoRNAs hydrolase)